MVQVKIGRNRTNYATALMAYDGICRHIDANDHMSREMVLGLMLGSIAYITDRSDRKITVSGTVDRGELLGG